MAENLTPKKYIDSSNMKQILTAVKNEISSDNGIITTEAEYLALPEEQKLNNSYYLYDIGVHYKNGVAYSRKKPIQLTMEEYKALGEVDPDQEYIVSTDEQGILLGAEDIGYSNAVSNLPCTTVQGAIDKVNANLDEKVDYKVVVEDGTRYVEDVVTQDINTWLPNDNSSIVINLKKANGANYSNFQLLCNKKDSKNWSCIVNGVANELWKIRYIDGVRYIDELATMDKVVKYPDWSNQQKISETGITVDQDVYIELNQLSSSPIEDLKINGKDVSVSDFNNGLYSTKFSGYVKKGSFVSYPYLTNANIVRVFPLV